VPNKKSDQDGQLLDLAAFTDRETCLRLAAHGCPKAYTAIAKKHLASTDALTTAYLLYCSFVSRMRGLHEGILRELAADNPHAVLPLTRAWAEVVALAIYVGKNPEYARSLLDSPKNGGPGRKSFQAIFAAIQPEVGNMKAVYEQLSEYSHFSSVGVWNAHTLREGGEVHWTDVPHWRDEAHFKIACAQARELAQAGQEYLDRLGEVLGDS